MYFKQLFEQTLKETPLVKFIKTLKTKKVLNKPIKIPKINTEFDRYELVIEYNGKVYSWIIIGDNSDYVEKSDDAFSKYDKCIENLIKVLKDQSL